MFPYTNTLYNEGIVLTIYQLQKRGGKNGVPQQFILFRRSGITVMVCKYTRNETQPHLSLLKEKETWKNSADLKFPFLLHNSV